MRKHQREVAEYLRDEYGIDDIRLRHGGKHSKLVFIYQDKERVLPIGNPSTDRHAIKNLHTDLKKKLGVPITKQHTVPITKQHTTEDLVAELKSSTTLSEMQLYPSVIEVMEDNIVETPTMTTKTWDVKMCAYKSSSISSVVWFIFPIEVWDKFPTGANIERLDDEHWKISPGERRTFHKYGNYVKIVYNDQVPPFGASWGEAIEESGEILVFLAKDKRHIVNTPTLTGFPTIESEQEKPIQTTRIPPKVKEPDFDRGPRLPREGMPLAPDLPQTPPTPAPSPPPVSSSMAMEVRMRSLINAAREIEALCPYRLTRMPDGRLVWQAPVIE